MIKKLNNKIEYIYDFDKKININEEIFICVNGVNESLFSGGNKFNVKVSSKLVDSIFERKVSIVTKQKLEITNIEKIITLDCKIQEFIGYNTFINASATCFVRLNGIGLFTSFANPFCKFEKIDDYSFKVEFEPNLILLSGEKYNLDLDFLGVYKVEGEKLIEYSPRSPLSSMDEGYMTRYHNPTKTPLYYSEILSFSSFVKKYLSPFSKKFVYMFYLFFSPIKPQPSSEEEMEEYFNYIDSLKKLGGTHILFNPLQRQTLPSIKKPYWTCYEKGSIAEKVALYANKKGLSCGIYMGSAQWNQDYCNSSVMAYESSKDRPLWKKVNKEGKISEENCLGSDEFTKKYIAFQKNTIKKYNLKIWDWDPGVGNGSFCYSSCHGHIPGKGQYKGFLNAMKVLKSLKHSNGRVYYQAFHGMKEYGIWGLKYFDQHEAFWEQDPTLFATMYPDYSADRITTSGMRFQAWCNNNFRFLPGVINHSIPNRMIQSCDNPEEYLREILDNYGYEYGLMSALAVGGSVTSTVIPRCFDNKERKEFLEFYKKWIKWGKKNYRYLQNCISFGSWPDTLKIDSYSRIVKDKGYIFLCNSNPVKLSIDFYLDKQIGFEGGKEYSFEEIYPGSGYVFDNNLKTSFKYGDKVSICVDKQTVRVLKIVKKKDVSIYGINGNGNIAKAFIEQGKKIDVYCKNENCYLNSTLLNKGKNTILFGEDTTRDIRLNGEKDILEDGVYKSSLKGNIIISGTIKESFSNSFEYLDKVIEEKKEPSNSYLSWTRLNKVYLNINFVDADMVRVKAFWGNDELNLLPISFRSVNSLIGKENPACCSYICEINCDALWNKEVPFRIEYSSKYEDMFLNAELIYPRLSKTSTCKTIEINEDLRISKLIGNRKAYFETQEKIIDSAYVGEFVPYTDNKVTCKLNIDNSLVDKVICNLPICIDPYCQPLMLTDKVLTYNDSLDVYEVDFKVGSRTFIITDDYKIQLAVFTKDGRFDSCNIPINWEVV